MAKCSIEGCDNASRTRGWCRFHYQRFHRWGDPLSGPPKDETKVKPQREEVVNFIKACSTGVVERLLETYTAAAIAEYYKVSTDLCYKTFNEMNINYQKYGRRITESVTVAGAARAGALGAKAIAMYQPWVKQ